MRHLWSPNWEEVKPFVEELGRLTVETQLPHVSCQKLISCLAEQLKVASCMAFAFLQLLSVWLSYTLLKCLEMSLLYVPTSEKTLIS